VLTLWLFGRLSREWFEKVFALSEIKPSSLDV